ncbi:Mu transposase C-terminal domain-containing protein [Snodgrassella alvi]|uniref:Mu transposase C-terminal domain-containing protein n=1 Tax=Snodgrassella alvi TaxID=1196083 RepID=UPI003D054DC9
MEYINAKELINLGIQTLPSTVKNVIERARRENWPNRKRVGRGGGLEYLVNGLPAYILTEVKERLASQILLKLNNQSLPVEYNKKKRISKSLLQETLIYDEVKELNTKQQEIAYARMSICQEVNKMHDVANLGIKESVRYVINQLELGLLPEYLTKLIATANARNSNTRSLSFSTLYSWIRAYKGAKTPNERLAALSPKQTKPKTPLLAYGWLPDFMAFYSNANSPNITEAYRRFAKNWIETGNNIVNLPSIDVVRRALKKMPVIALERGRKTGAAYKSLLPYVKRDWLSLSPNDVWIGDGHSFKAKIAHPDHGRPFKPEVTMIVDCCRMIVGFSVSLAESTIAVADALRIGIKNFGLPLMYYSDNGGGQTGKMIDHEVTGYCARLGVHHETGMPGNPQGRGIIEGLWDSTLIALAKEYDTYTGRGVDSSTKNLMYRKLESAFNAENKGKELTAEQKRYKSKLPSWKQFIADVARCIDEYNNRPHRSLPKKNDGIHFTPAEYRQIRLEADKVEIERLTDSELDTLFMPEEVRITKRGLISLMDNSYFHIDLANYHGEQVRVAYDLHDYEHVIVRTMEGKFICKAVFEGNKRDAMPKPLIQQLKEKRVKHKVQRKENQIAIDKQELRPVIEQQPDFGLLLGNGAAVTVHDYAEAKKNQDKPLFMFESDRDAWLEQEKNKND